MAIYGFVVRRCCRCGCLLEPRDYLSTYVKLGPIARCLVVGVFIVHPGHQVSGVEPRMLHGGGPINQGARCFRFCLSRDDRVRRDFRIFHSLVSSGTTPKMLNKECDARVHSVMERWWRRCLVAVLSLIAACSLFPGDYFGINVPAEAVASVRIAHGEPGSVLE